MRFYSAAYFIYKVDLVGGQKGTPLGKTAIFKKKGNYNPAQSLKSRTLCDTQFMS